MYFKRLELFGFKSFADKTKLKFEPGVTAVVGPNGCGKSNISDAIKWVLGEQSAKELRGARMEDIIFNGTSNKEPISMAEVSLVLSNKDKKLPIDYEEVVITRRLFRSGESEYLLNKMPVRLKDINNLLAGTGIGTSSYSIIEQGRIGLILSSKPEERRHLFEEASGITKYKAQKKEALRKLEHTETNLVRINDIINEVQRQVQSIERQAKKAEKYKASFDELKGMEIKHSYFQYRNISNELKTMDIELDDLKKRETEKASYCAELSIDVENARKQVDGINENIHKVRRDISETDAAMDKNTHTVKIDRERTEELKGLTETLNKELESLRVKYENKKKALDEYKTKLLSISDEKGQKESALRAAEEGVKSLVTDIEIAHQEIKGGRARLFDIEAEQTKTKNELMNIGAEIQSKRIRIRRLKVEKENVLKEKEEYDAKMSAINARCEEANGKLNSRKNALSLLEGRLGQAETSLKEIRALLANLRKDLEVSKSKRDMLEELIEKHEGFSKSVKEIMAKTNDPGSLIKARPLAEVISVQAGYEQAVESVLGDLTDAIVVGTREEAGQLIGFLKKEKQGRANFIIGADAFLRKNGFMNRIPQDSEPISNFVKCADEYQAVLSQIFGDVYLVDTPEAADAQFSRFRDCTFVTREGYLREGIRVLDGAAIETDTSVLGRKERLIEIKNRIALLDSQIEEEAVREKNEEAIYKESRSKIADEEKTLRAAEIEFANIESEKQAFADNIRRVDDEIMVVDTDINEETSSVEAFTKRGEELNQSLNVSEEDNTKVHSLVLRFEEDVKEKSAMKERTLLRIADIKGELSSIQITYDNISSNLELRREECREIEMETEEKKSTIQNSAQRMEELSDEIVQLEADMQAMIENKNYQEKTLSSLLEAKNKETEIFKAKETLLKNAQGEIEGFRNGIRDIDVKISDVGHRKSSLADRMMQMYKEDLAVMNMEIDEGTNWDEEREKIEELRQKVDKMGPVNLVAIEEHRELEERCAFLTKQKDDLVNAKDSLHKAIIKINATTRKLFLDTFNKVQAEFKGYYRMLFGGGQAEIFLLDDRDVLECGIEIVVRPPGKKLQNILLLSGGEKALTAIALMFAIFKVNPSPFCVLDEIDAPLDETNIDRFTRVLQEFLKTSQFIMITHNKKTMQMADILYGITMAERGISKIVSVNFSEGKDQDKEKEEVMV